MDKIKSFVFSGGEIHVQLDKKEYENQKEINLECKLYTPEEQLKLILILNAFSHLYKDRKNYINLNILYFPYARQDRVCAEGQAFSLEAYLKMLSPYLNLISKINVLDMHSPVLSRNCRKVNNIDLADKIEVEKYQDVDFIISPDGGARVRAYMVSRKLNKKVLQADKERDPNTGFISKYNLPDHTDLKDKIVLVVDDICDGGKTFELLGQELLKRQVKNAYLLVSHGIFSKGFSELNKYYSKIECINRIIKG